MEQTFNPLIQTTVDSCALLNDQEVSLLVQKILESHNLTLTPQIVIQVNKVQPKEPSFLTEKESPVVKEAV